MGEEATPHAKAGLGEAARRGRDREDGAREHGTLLTRVSWSQHCEDADLRALGIGGAAQQCLIDGGGPGGVRLDLRYLCALGRRRGDSAREQVDGASGREALAMDHRAAAARAAGRSENQRWRGGDSLHTERRDRDNQGRDNDEQSDKQQAMLEMQLDLKLSSQVALFLVRLQHGAGGGRNGTVPTMRPPRRASPAAHRPHPARY